MTNLSGAGVARDSRCLCSDIADAELAAQFFLYEIENLLDAQLFRHLKKAGAGLLGKPHQSSSAIRTAQRDGDAAVAKNGSQRNSVRVGIGEQD